VKAEEETVEAVLYNPLSKLCTRGGLKEDAEVERKDSTSETEWERCTGVSDTVNRSGEPV
jgi:hypothetical protein